MKIKDWPMACCGMLEAYEISAGLASSVEVMGPFGSYFNSSDEDWERHFAQIEEKQKAWRRNCAMMTLSTQQGEAQRHALRLGWEPIFKFYNPNSFNEVTLFVKVLWKDVNEYGQAVEAGYDPPRNRVWGRDNTEEEDV